MAGKVIDMTEGTGFRREFLNPLISEFSQELPKDLKSLFDLCLYLWIKTPTYSQASKKVISHFITDCNFAKLDNKTGTGIKGVDNDDRYDIMVSKVKVLAKMLEIGLDFFIYGNAFARIHLPFSRYLRYKDQWMSVHAFNPADLKYNWSDLTYTVLEKPKKGSLEAKQIKCPFKDIPETNTYEEIRIVKLDPRYMELDHCYMSNQTRYIYRFPDWMINDIKNGSAYSTFGVPLAMLRAIKDQQSHFAFNKGAIFHLKEPAVSGVSNRGWGLPHMLLNFTNIYQLQYYQKIDETITKDFMFPFRMFSPNFQGMGDMQNYQMLMAEWSAKIGQAISMRRKDPKAMHGVPVPVNYQEFGGNGKSLVPKDLWEHQNANMLNGFGYPAELYNGTMNIQTIPSAIRIFENSFMFLHNGLQEFLTWATDSVMKFTQLEPLISTLERPSMADSMETRSQLLQLVAGGEIPRAAAYKHYGITDPVLAKTERMEEDLDIAKQENSKNKEFEAEMQAGSIDKILDVRREQEAQMAAQQGGGPLGPGGPAPNAAMSQHDPMMALDALDETSSPLEVKEVAQTLAIQLEQLPVGQRRVTMQNIKAKNETVYAVMMQIRDDMVAQGMSQGRQMAREQMAEGGQ